MANPKFTTEELESEEWRDVIGYEGIYSVSNLGRVRRDRQSCGTQAGLILKTFPDKYSYSIVTLNRGGKGRSRKVHQLVAVAFIGARPEGQEVNHKRAPKSNNRAGNLEYMSNDDNKQHAKRHGYTARGDRNAMRKHPELVKRGEQNANAITTAAVVLEIRQAHAAKSRSDADSARLHGLSRSLVYAIVHRKIWKHI